MAETHHLHNFPTFNAWGSQPNDVATAASIAGAEPPLDDQIRRKLTTHLRHSSDHFNVSLDPDVHHVSKPEEEEPLRKSRRHRRSSTRRHLWRNSSTSPSPSPPPPTTKSSRTRSTMAGTCERRRRLSELSVSLSRDEIDEDFYALTGRRASGRPKRRPPAVRKFVDVLFPGLGLSEVTAACYDVVRRS